MIKRGTRVRITRLDGVKEFVLLDDAFDVTVDIDCHPVRSVKCYAINGEFVPVQFVEILKEED